MIRIRSVGDTSATDAAYAAKSSWSWSETGVVLLPTFITLVTTVTPSSCAAVATFRRTFLSSGETSFAPGAHVCVMRTPRKPARTSMSICFFASSGDAERTASAVAPIRSAGPPLSNVGGATARAAVATAAERRIMPHMASATVAGTVENGVQEQLKGIPAKPGVYLFRDDRGEVLYVGKAKSLRSRVRSYFQKTTDGRAQIQFLPERIADLEVIVTGSEVEALHLEQNLVKRHRPPFNVRLRDDKSFPYIAVTVEDEYPRVMFTRERHRRGVWYFGPYANAKKVRETLDVLNRVFPYRPCEGPKPGRHSGIPCLDYHIDRCLAPCVGYVSKEDYRAIIDRVIEFLSGDVKPIQRELERQMHEAAREERFEDAARYRNRLHAVQHLVERQSVERQSVGNVDVIGFAVEEDRAVVQIFPLRGGRMIDRYSFHLENVGGQDLNTVLESFCLEYYGSAPSVPPQIVVPRAAGDLSALAEFLSEKRGARVEVRSAERGEKRRPQQLADENTRHAPV